jgi:hypothetical protein
MWSLGIERETRIRIRAAGLNEYRRPDPPTNTDLRGRIRRKKLADTAARRLWLTLRDFRRTLSVSSRDFAIRASVSATTAAKSSRVILLGFGGVFFAADFVVFFTVAFFFIFIIVTIP